MRKSNYRELLEAYEEYDNAVNKFNLEKIQESTLQEAIIQESFLKTLKLLLNNGDAKTIKEYIIDIILRLETDQHSKEKNISLNYLLKISEKILKKKGGIKGSEK